MTHLPRTVSHGRHVTARLQRQVLHGEHGVSVVVVVHRLCSVSASDGRMIGARRTDRQRLPDWLDRVRSLGVCVDRGGMGGLLPCVTEMFVCFVRDRGRTEFESRSPYTLSLGYVYENRNNWCRPCVKRPGRRQG